MKLAIMQPYFMPYIGYFQLIHAADKFIMYDDVSFIKQGWINRNTILLNSQPHVFSIPVNNISSNRKISDTEISYKVKWKEKFLKTIMHGYKKAPFFNEIYQLLETILSVDEKYISRIAVKSITYVAAYLRLNTEIIETSAGYNNSISSQERLLEICNLEKATEYINPIGGMTLYSKDAFKKAGINLHFLKPYAETYRQFNDAFIPWLSIIDVMMFNGPEKICSMLNRYELV